MMRPLWAGKTKIPMYFIRTAFNSHCAQSPLRELGSVAAYADAAKNPTSLVARSEAAVDAIVAGDVVGP